MALARNDALAPYGGAPRRSRARGCVTVREPAKGFFIAGSSIDPLNGIYFGARGSSLGLPRCPRIAYRNDQTGWLMVLHPAPGSQSPSASAARSARARRRHTAHWGSSSEEEEEDEEDDDSGYRREMEWCLIDTCGYERFVHKGDTIIPGAGRRWRHVRRPRPGEAARPPEPLAWHECGSEEEYETGAEEEGELETRARPRRPALQPAGALAEYVEDDEDELPWQVIAVLDFEVLRDLKGAWLHYRQQIEKARAGANLPRPGPKGLEDSCQPGCWVFRVVAPGGVDLRTAPSTLSRKLGHYPNGHYVCVVEHQGAWARLAQTPGVSDDFAFTDARQEDGSIGIWVQVDGGSGRPRLVPVAEADGASLGSPPEGGPEAELFDRPFEPRLQGPQDEEASKEEAEEEEDCPGEALRRGEAEEAKAEGAALQCGHPRELAVGAEVGIEGLADARWNGLLATVVSRASGSGRHVVRLRQGGAEISVRAAGLRPVLPGETGREGRAARVLGLTLAELGLSSAAAGGPSPARHPRRRLEAALRAAQREAVEAAEAAVDAQEAYDLLLAALGPEVKRDGAEEGEEAGEEATPSGDEPQPPHAAVASGELGAHAAAAARAAGGASSIAAVEEGLGGLRQLLSREQRRLASSAGLAWPLRAAELHRAPPEGADALRLRLSLVHGLLRCRKESQALQEALAAARAHPAAAAAHLWAGRALLRQARRDEAILALERAASSTSYGTADAAWGCRGAATRLRAIRSADCSRRRAQDAYAYGDFEAAARRFSEALAASPAEDRWGRAGCLASRAACHRRARQLGRAIEDADAALALFPRFGRALFRKAACLLEAGRPDEAVRAFEVLLRLDRSWPGLCDWLVRAHALAKRAERSAAGPRGQQGRGAETRDEAGGNFDGLHADSADYYAVLGVPADATDKQLKRAYRLMSLKYHPDKQGGSTRLFQAISTAYETLADPEKRRAYDDGADVKRRERADSESDSEREERSLREEVERKYFPERYKFWPFGDPFIEKRKLQASRRRQQAQAER